MLMLRKHFLQLPSLILPGITLLISPLVALMVDQLRKLPKMLPGGLLCSNQVIKKSLSLSLSLCVCARARAQARCMLGLIIYSFVSDK